MNVSELKGTSVTSRNGDSPTTTSVSAKTNVEDQKSTSDNFADSDEGDELEPVAAVDVLPGREEDFLPEGMTQEFVEPSRNTWTTCWVSNDDLTDHQLSWQESQLVGRKSILQSVLEVPHQIWPLQIQPLGSYSTTHLTRKLAQNVEISQNHMSEPNQPRAVPNDDRRQYYKQYRQKYPELIRIRNRENARRYRQANAERVRERQRDYVRSYRERKRIKKEQADILDMSEEPEIAISDESGLKSAFLSKKCEKEIIVQNMPAAMKSKNSESEHDLKQ
ncbi:hypothetical protein R5R35_000477 [Gryllus longicercus]|uniref:Uncharacterized protein n=1 Tax=Gryllus longicercus TaxID=2509291 RepID=A0AAN9Z2U9_9ORTH